MELFDTTNPYYVESAALPTLPAPHFEQTIKISKQVDMHRPNYNRLQAAKCCITLTHKTKLRITGTHPLLPKNPFLVKVNLKDDEQVTKEIAGVKQAVKLVRQQFSSRAPFSTLMPLIIQTLVQGMSVDITAQRGQNPFIHRHDYTAQWFHVAAQFGTPRQSAFILKLLDELYVPSRIKLCQLVGGGGSGMQVQEVTFQSINVVDIHTKQDIQTLISDVQAHLEHQDKFQVVYIDFPVNSDTYLYQLFIAILVVSTLQDQGCFIFRTKQLHLPQINYFLYLYAQLFNTLVIEKSDQNHSLLQNSIYVGCYGFDATQGQDYLQDLLGAYHHLQLNPECGLFDYKLMPADNEFERELTQFHSSLHKHRKAQVEIFQWTAQQLENGAQPGDIALQIAADREKAKVEDKEHRESQRDRQSKSHYQHRRQQQSSTTAYNPKLMNPIPQVQSLQTTFGTSPDLVRHNRPKPPPPNQVHESKDRIKEKEQQKMEKLLATDTSTKRDKKDHREERLSRFQR